MTLAAAEHITGLLASGLPRDTDWLALLVKLGLDQLPKPGSGRGATLERWRALAAVGQFDLSLIKLYEGHTDALAIFDEIDDTHAQVAPGSWCVWAAEAPGGRCLVHRLDGANVALSGSKHWCSGAATSDHALLTAWASDGSGPQLVAVALDQPGITIDASHWKAVGMAGSMSVRVTFEDTSGVKHANHSTAQNTPGVQTNPGGPRGRCIGQPGQYLSRPGFWHGGAGLAACWYGGCVGIATVLKAALNDGLGESAGFKFAALGRVELALQETAATLRQAAAWIDAHPTLDASAAALTTRLSAEKCAKLVIDEAGKAMGATPFCLNEKFARAVADLPVFIRQSHADRDFAALGERALKKPGNAWTL